MPQIPDRRDCPGKGEEKYFADERPRETRKLHLPLSLMHETQPRDYLPQLQSQLPPWPAALLPSAFRLRTCLQHPGLMMLQMHYGVAACIQNFVRT